MHVMEARLEVERALPLTSPAYDLGATEPELCKRWKAHFDSLNEL